jgi:hypothetical protein
VHVFAAVSWTGVPAETEEMRPRWFDAAEIPFDEMWADDRHWFPLFLAGRRFRGEFLFRDGITLVAHALETLPERKTAL